MSSARNDNRPKGQQTDTQSDDQDQFGSMFGDDVEPLKGKGAAFVPKSAEVTPGVIARRKAAQLEMQADGNFLDPDSIITQVAALDPLEYNAQ